MKLILFYFIITLATSFTFCFGQESSYILIRHNDGTETRPCEYYINNPCIYNSNTKTWERTDTIKGIIYYQDTNQTHSTITKGYYITTNGGYRIGNFYGYDNIPTFIPAYFIRNDEVINGKRQFGKYERQRNSGYFTDEHFNRIPFEAIYGLLVMNLTEIHTH